MKSDKYQLIINYLKDSVNHERKKIEIIRKFDINKNTFKWILTQLTKKYPVYENDTGRIIGILYD